MPSNVRRFYTSILFLTFAAGTIAAQAQQTLPTPVQPAANATTAAKAPTSGDIMRERISKSKAYIAVRNYNAAIYELENIRRETSDSSVNAVSTVLLMNSYLEQGDYKKANEFLGELYTQQKSNKLNAGAYHSAVSAQVVKSARNQIDRYRALGLMVSDRNLPLEAVNDIERMRETLELVITQAKEMSADKTKSAGAMGILEEATNTRSALARDDYDARRWRDAIADSREQLANSRSVITNAVDGTTTQTVVPQVSGSASQQSGVSQNTVVPGISTAVPMQSGQPQNNTQPIFRPVGGEPIRPGDTQASVTAKPLTETNKATPTRISPINAERGRVVPNRPNVDSAVAGSEVSSNSSTSDVAGNTSPLEVGSLIAYATSQQAPNYPAAARNVRASGVVKVEITVNETGDVTAVQKTTGPPMLQTAAKDAIRKWKFRPFKRGGQPVKATGFVNFNFNL